MSFIISRSSRDQITLEIIRRMVELELTNAERVKQYGKEQIERLIRRGGLSEVCTNI